MTRSRLGRILGRRLPLLLLVLLSFIAGHGLSSSSPSDSPDRRWITEVVKEVRLGRGARLSNPLLDYVSASTSDPSLLALRGKIQGLAERYTEEGALLSLSVYFRDLDTGHWFGINEDRKYVPASLLKVPLLLLYMRLAGSVEALRDERAVYEPRPDDAANQTEVPPLRDGQSYSLWELLERMIVYSDNVASNLLAEYLYERWDPDTVRLATVESDLIAPVLSYPDGTLVVTANSYSGLFRVLYNATYLDRDQSEEALGLLARSSFDGGIAAGVPQGTVVANKYGYGGDPRDPSDHQFHDCGIVYGAEGPYILCVLTKTAGVLPPHEIIAAVSREVYDHLHGSDLSPLDPSPARPGNIRPY